PPPLPAAAPLAPLKKKFRYYRLPRGVPAWDSPLILLGGGGLVLLLLIGSFVWWSLGRTSGDQVFAAAEADYSSGAYTQAIHKYDQFLRRFPRHASVSMARVHRGLAQLRVATENGTDWPT